jgi:hypothetical protein
MPSRRGQRYQTSDMNHSMDDSVKTYDSSDEEIPDAALESGNDFSRFPHNNAGTGRTVRQVPLGPNVQNYYTPNPPPDTPIFHSVRPKIELRYPQPARQNYYTPETPSEPLIVHTARPKAHPRPRRFEVFPSSSRNPSALPLPMTIENGDINFPHYRIQKLPPLLVCTCGLALPECFLE